MSSISSSLRLLKKQQQNNDQDPNLYIFTVYGFLSVTIVVCVLILIYRKCKYQYNQQQPQSSNYEYDKIFPSINMRNFKKYVLGHIFTKQYIENKQNRRYFNNFQECVICLQNYNDDQSQVRFTICSHLYHSKCLMDWTKRQLCCPTCRESFHKISIDKFQRDTQINFDQIFEEERKPSKMKLSLKSQNDKKKRNKSRMIPNYGIQMTKSEIEVQRQQQDQQYYELPFETRYPINIYRKILIFHKNTQQNLQKSRITRPSQLISRPSQNSKKLIKFYFQEQSQNKSENENPEIFRIEYTQSDKQSEDQQRQHQN